MRLDQEHAAPPDGYVGPGMPTPSHTKRLLRGLDTKAKKRLGQHFLVDRRVRAKILQAAELQPNDVVIEVGPGLGELTGELARRARLVIAIEKDEALAGRLQEALVPVPNVRVIIGDMLQMDPGQVLEQAGETGKGSPPKYKVVADLPYNIASAVLRLFLEAAVKPQLMVVMVQREVAENIVARPGDMSILSIAIQLYGKPRIVGNVSPRSFYPPPRVASAILRIEPYPTPRLPLDDAGAFFRVVRAGFSARRKQLRNSLAQGLGVPEAEALRLLNSAGIDPQRRAQTLSIEEWGTIYRSLKQQEAAR